MWIGRDAPHQRDATLRCCGSGGGSAERTRPHSQASSDRLTRLIGPRVMSIARSLQWAARASGVMPRLSGQSIERGFWLVGYLSTGGTIPASLKLYNPGTDTCRMRQPDRVHTNTLSDTVYVTHYREKYESLLIFLSFMCFYLSISSIIITTKMFFILSDFIILLYFCLSFIHFLSHWNSVSF